MIQTIENRTIALSGLFQAISLVREVAETGDCDQKDLETSLTSILITQPNTVESVFGGCHNLKRGVNALLGQLCNETDDGQRNRLLTQHAVSIIHLSKQLSATPDANRALSDRLEHIRLQVEHMGITHRNTIDAFGEAYEKLIRPLGPSIMIAGEPEHLKNPYNVSKIRALLLAAIRSSRLWQQCHGSRWKLILERNKICRAGNQLLESIKNKH